MCIYSSVNFKMRNAVNILKCTFCQSIIFYQWSTNIVMLTCFYQNFQWESSIHLPYLGFNFSLVLKKHNNLSKFVGIAMTQVEGVNWTFPFILRATRYHNKVMTTFSEVCNELWILIIFKQFKVVITKILVMFIAISWRNPDCLHYGMCA